MSKLLPLLGRVRLLALLLCVSPLGSASASTDDVARAEYVRLSQKLETLATKNAWSGVERTYLEMLETGETLSFDDHLLGANAARAQGDVTNARLRLTACNELREDRSVLEWLYDIDMNYGKVSLKADVGAAALDAKAMPFDPMAAGAVGHAKKQVEETGIFEGYLPAGEYTFGKYEVRVRPQVTGERIDIRTVDNPLPVSKSPKKKKD